MAYQVFELEKQKDLMLKTDSLNEQTSEEGQVEGGVTSSQAAPAEQSSQEDEEARNLMVG